MRATHTYQGCDNFTDLLISLLQSFGIGFNMYRNKLIERILPKRAIFILELKFLALEVK